MSRVSKQNYKKNTKILIIGDKNVTNNVQLITNNLNSYPIVNYIK